MYKRRLLSSILFLSTPPYPNRSYLRARMEGFEYTVLFSIRDSMGKILKYTLSKNEQNDMIFHWGKLWLLIDDLQDEIKDVISNKDLRNILIGKSYTSPKENALLADMINSAKYINERVSKTPHWQKYVQMSSDCFDNQIALVSSRKKHSLLKQTAAIAEKKGGSCVVSLICALNPSNMTKNTERTAFICGSWVQMIDDFADREKDKAYNIFTIFTTVPNPKETLKTIANRYEQEITSLLKRNDVIIPLAKDITSLANLVQFPIFSNIFKKLNS